MTFSYCHSYLFCSIHTMNEPASSGSGQDFDVFSVMDWKDGIGTLPGSDLKVIFYNLQYALEQVA